MARASVRYVALLALLLLRCSQSSPLDERLSSPPLLRRALPRVLSHRLRSSNGGNSPRGLTGRRTTITYSCLETLIQIGEMNIFRCPRRHLALMLTPARQMQEFLLLWHGAVDLTWTKKGPAGFGGSVTIHRRLRCMPSPRMSNAI